VLTGTALFLVGNAVAAVAGQLWVLMLARAVSGLGAAMAGPSIWAHVADTVPAEQRGRAIGAGGGFFAAGQVLGLPIGTFIAAAAGWHATFAAIAVASLGALVLLHRQVPPAQRKAAARPDWAGVFRVWRHPVAGHALAVTVLLSAANLGAYSYLGTVLAGRFGLTESQRGWVGLLIGGGSFVGSTVAGRLGDRARRGGGRGIGLVPVWCTVLGAGVIAAALLPWLGAVLVAVLVWFVASGAFGTDQQTLLASAAPDLRATAASWNSSSLYLGTAVGVSLVGSVTPARDGMALVGGVLAAVAALTAAVLVLRLRRRDAAVATGATAGQPTGAQRV
jgi:DHA1 family inner membrane transport protein